MEGLRTTLLLFLMITYTCKLVSVYNIHVSLSSYLSIYDVCILYVWCVYKLLNFISNLMFDKSVNNFPKQTHLSLVVGVSVV